MKVPAHPPHDWSILRDDHLINKSADNYQVLRKRFMDDEAARIAAGGTGRRKFKDFCCYLWRIAHAESLRLHRITQELSGMAPIRHLDLEHAEKIDAKEKEMSITKHGDTITKYGVNAGGDEAEKTAEDAEVHVPDDCKVCHQKIASDATGHVCPEGLN